jgi:hypothetical protein
MKQLVSSLLVAFALSACSGVEVIPGDTAAFEATGYTQYAWRSEALSQPDYSKDKIYQADPFVRASVEEEMAALGYQRVEKEDAEFLVEYVAAAGFNDSLLPRSATNVGPYNTGTINRLPDGASVDNAYALSGVKETGNIMLVFVDKSTAKPIWQVRISSLIQDTNKVDEGAVRRAVRSGLSYLPAVSP